MYRHQGRWVFWQDTMCCVTAFILPVANVAGNHCTHLIVCKFLTDHAAWLVVIWVGPFYCNPGWITSQMNKHLIHSLVDFLFFVQTKFGSFVCNVIVASPLFIVFYGINTNCYDLCFIACSLFCRGRCKNGEQPWYCRFVQWFNNIYIFCHFKSASVSF